MINNHSNPNVQQEQMQKLDHKNAVKILSIFLGFAALVLAIAGMATNTLSTIRENVLGIEYVAKIGWENVRHDGVTVMFSKIGIKDSDRAESAGQTWLALNIISVLIMAAVLLLSIATFLNQKLSDMINKSLPNKLGLNGLMVLPISLSILFIIIANARWMVVADDVIPKGVDKKVVGDSLILLWVVVALNVCQCIAFYFTKDTKPSQTTEVTEY